MQFGDEILLHRWAKKMEEEEERARVGGGGGRRRGGRRRRGRGQDGREWGN
jgi:hypothetical protein